MNENAITTTNLTKFFGDNKALDNLTFEVKKGELFGLVGPDGAGKTTTMRILTGIMLPSGGEAQVSGFTLPKQSSFIRDKIGYMSQRFGLYEDLTVIENINFYADIYKVPAGERASRIEELLGFSNLTPFKNRLAGNLSGGMKQKLGLACALIHTPEVLFLDEPTNGVDPTSRRDFWRILYQLLKGGMTILVSTAYLDEAERCNRVGLIYKGRLLIKDTPADIKKTIKFPMVEIIVDDIHKAKRVISKIQDVKSVSVYGEKIHALLENKKTADTISAEFKKNGINIKALKQVVPSLEDVFINMVEAHG
ncbi:MAG: ABC transporter ATP-binding protein [Armatimonadota bacterium]